MLILMKYSQKVNNAPKYNYGDILMCKYPKLNSDSRVHDLMAEVEGSENRISVEDATIFNG